MKVDPVNFILNDNFSLNKSFYFISGNDSTFIDKIKELLIKRLKEIDTFGIDRIKNISSIKSNINLFDDKKVYITNDLSDIDEGLLNSLVENRDKYIFFHENSSKTKSIKNIFLKRSDCCFFECYELSKEAKIKIMNKYLNNHKQTKDVDAFWYLLEKLDNRYAFLENELVKLVELNEVKLSKSLIDKVVANNQSDLESIFFQIFKSNKELINIYNKKISSVSEVGSLYYVFKQFSYLIISSQDELEFRKKIPRYLFREVDFLLNLFKKFNVYKKNIC